MFFSVLLNVLVLVGVALPRGSSCTSYVYLFLLGEAVPYMCQCTVQLLMLFSMLFMRMQNVKWQKNNSGHDFTH